MIDDDDEKVHNHVFLIGNLVRFKIQTGNNIMFIDFALDKKKNYGVKVCRSHGSSTSICVAKLLNKSDENFSTYNIITGEACTDLSWASVDSDCIERARKLSAIISDCKFSDMMSGGDYQKIYGHGDTIDGSIGWFEQLLFNIKVLNVHLLEVQKDKRNNTLAHLVDSLKKWYKDKGIPDEFTELDKVFGFDNLFLSVSYIVQTFTQLSIHTVNWGNYLFYLARFYNITWSYTESPTLKVDKFGHEDRVTLEITNNVADFHYYVINSNNSEVVQQIVQKCLLYKVSSNISSEIYEL